MRPGRKNSRHRIMLIKRSLSTPFLRNTAGCDTLQNALNLQKPKASLKGLKLENISLDSANLLFDVEIENPYPVDLPMVNVDYSVTSNTNKLFSGKADIEGTVPAKSTKMVSLPAKISYLDVVNAFKGIRPGSKSPIRPTRAFR